MVLFSHFGKSGEGHGFIRRVRESSEGNDKVFCGGFNPGSLLYKLSVCIGVNYSQLIIAALCLEGEMAALVCCGLRHNLAAFQQRDFCTGYGGMVCQLHTALYINRHGQDNAGCDSNRYTDTEYDGSTAATSTAAGRTTGGRTARAGITAAGSNRRIIKGITASRDHISHISVCDAALSPERLLICTRIIGFELIDVDEFCRVQWVDGRLADDDSIVYTRRQAGKGCHIIVAADGSIRRRNDAVFFGRKVRCSGGEDVTVSAVDDDFQEFIIFSINLN